MKRLVVALTLVMVGAALPTSGRASEARIAAGYSEIFRAAASVRDSGLVVNDLMMARIRAESPVRAELDGRVR
jgi:hypothetical protein